MDEEHGNWTTRDRRRIRLPREAYAELGSVWHVICSTKSTIERAFDDSALLIAVSETICLRAQARGAILHLYCVMPDHVHLIIEIRDDDLVAIVSDLKSHIARIWWGFGRTGTPWMRRFYDRGIRDPYMFEETVRYILNNPVKAGLVERWEDYPFLGGALVGNGSS